MIVLIAIEIHLNQLFYYYYRYYIRAEPINIILLSWYAIITVMWLNDGSELRRNDVYEPQQLFFSPSNTYPYYKEAIVSS